MNRFRCLFRPGIARLAYPAGLIAILAIAGCEGEPRSTQVDEDFAGEVCAGLPRRQNAGLPLSSASDDWFQVYESADGVYSIVEPYQFQETISHLIVGETRAILFDTGLGLLPIRPVVERITDLPVTVLNSHTHFDHVGGNWEFESVLAIDTRYTRANMAGFSHERIASDFVADAFCRLPPAGIDPGTARTRPWTASAYVRDTELLDLGDRQLEVLHVPGHTPDSLALVDTANGLLFTGDTFYDAPIWLFVPESNLDQFGRSVARLAKREQQASYLLGAHNAARVPAGRLGQVSDAFDKLRAGAIAGEPGPGGQLVFRIDGVEFVTATEVLQGKQGATDKGGSGLDSWR